MSVVFAEIVTSEPVALLVNAVETDEPVVRVESVPVGLGLGLRRVEDSPVAVLEVTPVPGPVTPPLIVEDPSVGVVKMLLVKLERSDVTPLMMELKMLVSDAVEVADAVEETPVPGPVTPPEIVEDSSVVVSVGVGDALVSPVSDAVVVTPVSDAVVVIPVSDAVVVTPVLGPVTPPEIVVEVSVADASVVVPKTSLVRLERSDVRPLTRELKRPGLEVVAVAATLVPVPAPVIPETVVSVSELVAASLVAVVTELVTPVPGPVADASIVDVTSVGVVAVVSVVVAAELVTPVPGPVADASMVEVTSVGVVAAVSVVADSVVGVAAELVTPVPGPVADASMVEVASVAEVVTSAVSLVVVGDDSDVAAVVAPVADASIVEMVSVGVASSVLVRSETALVTSDTTLETSDIKLLVRELRMPVAGPVVAAVVSMVDVVSAAVVVVESVGVVSTADEVSVEEIMMPLEV